MRLGPDASLLAVERVVEEGLIRECRAYNQRKPLITVIAHEMNSRAAPAAYAEAIQRASARMAQSEGRAASDACLVLDTQESQQLQRVAASFVHYWRSNTPMLCECRHGTRQPPRHRRQPQRQRQLQGQRRFQHGACAPLGKIAPYFSGLL